MTDDYTPTTQAVRLNYITANAGPYRGGEANAAAAFDRWLAAHDAEKRAEWEAEQGEAEWEYGLTWEPDVSGFDEPRSYSGCETELGALKVGRRLAGDAQSVKVWKRPMRPAIQAVPAGPWVPVNENGDAG